MTPLEGCPGSRSIALDEQNTDKTDDSGSRPSQLGQWPIQLFLVPPDAPYFSGADVLLTADCVAYAMGDFHKDYLKGKRIAIACPKLDQGGDIYRKRITDMIDKGKINSLRVMIMEVPCCMGLYQIARQAVDNAEREIPLKKTVVGIRGNIITEE